MLVWELVLSGREQLVPKILTDKTKEKQALVFSSKGIKLRSIFIVRIPYVHFFPLGRDKAFDPSPQFSSDVPIF